MGLPAGYRRVMLGGLLPAVVNRDAFRRAWLGAAQKEGPLARPFGWYVLRTAYFSFASARRAAARSVFSQEKAVALTVSPLPSR